MKYGLDVSQLQMEMALLMAGTTVGTLHSDGATYDVYIASPLEQISSAEQLAQLRLGTTTTVPLGEIASISFSPEVSRIMRYDQKPAAQITAVITAKDVGSINKEVEDKINSVITLPAGTEIRYGGIYEQMTEGFQSMGIAIIIAIIIAYFVMAITFRSFLNPFIIMFSLPVAAIGALFGLFITGRSLGIPAMMGMLMLVGIVLTNAIVLIALVDQLRRKGMSTHEALIQGGSTRLRPILMTAVATMLALLPLALGLSQGTIIAAELATVVIGGLFTSTLLTLIVVPVVYSLFHNKEHRTVEK
jgi:HAE1 family hydrophobic/amphiphilic exporter-1